MHVILCIHAPDQSRVIQPHMFAHHTYAPFALTYMYLFRKKVCIYVIFLEKNVYGCLIFVILQQ